MPVALKAQGPRRRSVYFLAVVAVAVTVCCATGCGWLRRLAGRPAEKPSRPRPHLLAPSGQARSSRAARKVVRQAIVTYGRGQAWKAREGLELEMTWKTYEAARVVDDPTLVQIALGPQPQIRIHLSKLDRVFALGDQGPWAMIRGRPDRDPGLVTRAHYRTATMAFFLSLPFNLNEPGVVVRDTETKAWGGANFDAVTIGFPEGRYPWPNDSMTLWFRRPNALLDRCFFVSTAAGSDLGPPPNYLWVFWKDHAPADGLPLARRWEFVRADRDGTMKEKLFDIEVTSVVAKRSFLPVMFREPVIEPRVRRLPTVGGRRATD